MNLLRKIELVHTVKCGKTTRSQISEQSNRVLSEFKRRLAAEGVSASLEKEVQQWMGSFPIVLDRDIEEVVSPKPNN